MRILLGFLLLGAGVANAAANSDDPVCVLSSPVAAANSTVNVSVWFGATASPGTDYKWDAPLRLLTDQHDGYTVWEWSLKGVQPGAADAELDVPVNGVKRSCGVHVKIVADLNRPEAQRGASSQGKKSKKSLPEGDFISASGLDLIEVSPNGYGEPTSETYGLYSYILFASQPASDADKQRNLDFFTQIARLIDPLQIMEQAAGAEHVNATRVPVSVRASGKATGDWLAKNYDYTGAKILLTQSGIPFQPDGLYIVSVTRPVSRKQKAAPPYLVIDLSKAPGRIANTWISAFLNQAAQQDFSNTKNLQYVVADMRNIVAITADVLPQLQQQIGFILKYVP